MKEVKEKVCFKCSNLLSIDNFYKHKRMTDGHLNKCIECTKKDIRQRESELRLDQNWVESEKERQRDKYYRLNYKGKHKPTSERKREIIKKHNQKFPEKVLARKYTEIFLTKNKGLNLHHWSYNQEHWLDIIELSIKEHNFLHRFIQYNQEKMVYETLDGILLDTKEKHINYYEYCKNK